MTQLKDILVKSDEQIDVKPECKYKQVTVKLWGKGVVLRSEVFGSEIAASKLHILHNQDFIMSRIDARNGAFGLVPDSLDGGIVSSDFPVFKPDLTRICPRFLEWMSRTNQFINFCKSASEGTTNRVRLKEDRFLASEIFLPPLEEQRRIVARIEELAARIEEARVLRRRAVMEVEALSNSHLSSIFSSFKEQYGLTQLDKLIVNAGYGTSAKCESERLDGAFPVLRIPNIVDEKISLNDIKYGILDASQLDRVLASKGDVLVVRTNGSAELVGRCAVVPRLSEPTAFASYLIRLKCDDKLIEPNYLQLMLKYLRNNGKLFNFARTTAGQYNVSLGRLRSAEMPVPPLSEQRCIIAQLNALHSKLDALRRHQAETAAALEALLPAVLERGFRGEL